MPPCRLTSFLSVLSRRCTVSFRLTARSSVAMADIDVADLLTSASALLPVWAVRVDQYGVSGRWEVCGRCTTIV